MLVFKKITVYKPVSSYIGKSNGICLKFLQGGNIERGSINIVVQQFFLVTHCPQALKMVLSSFFFPLPCRDGPYLCIPGERNMPEESV